MNHQLPIGFKFLPTDEELIDFYLRKRLEGSLQQNNLIMELNVYDYHPEMLLEGNDEGYFFTTRKRKYDKGKAINRVAGDGFWKMTSVEKVVCKNSNGCQIGKKHVLKYFGGTNSKKESTDWIMYEYEMDIEPNKFQDVVVCKIYNKGSNSRLQQNSYAQVLKDNLVPMDNHLSLGCKFQPTDEELIDFYLRKKLEGSLQQNNIIMELNVYYCHPEMLLAIYLEGNDEGYFFTTRGRKYDKGKVVNRVAGDGFWKMMSVEKVVRRNNDGCQIGKKHVLKYFGGTNSKKESTDWIMYEYEMDGDPDKFQDMVVCKIYNKGAKKIENRLIDFNLGLEDENLILQQNSYVPVEATDDDQWNINDDNQMFDIELLLQILP